MENELILKVQDLTVQMENRSVLEHLTFTVKRGEVITILGPNGAGKTVLLKCLLGLIPYRGKIEWCKDSVIGYVPQRLPFIKDFPLSVSDFFMLKKCSNQEMREILQAVGVREQFLSQRIGDLSSGEFQRILIAWALIGSPRVVLFDEPTTGVDIGGEETIYKLLTKLRKERDMTLLLVTHDLSVVYQFSTRVICLNRQTICYGPPQEALTIDSLRELYGGGEIKFYQHQHP